MQPLRLFVGHDHKEEAGLHVFVSSVLQHASGPVDITAITARMAQSLGVVSDGSNAFTKSRFLVPYLCGYRGWALWLDGSDMLARDDLYGLLSLRDNYSAVQVVKHQYETSRPVKYIGTDMETQNVSYPKKNWSSAMLVWCDHGACRKLTPEYVKATSGSELHRFTWVPDDRIGELPVEWNWLDEYGPNDAAKIMHYTTGIPGFRAYRNAPHAEEWHQTMFRAMRGLQTHRLEEDTECKLATSTSA